MEIQGNPAPTQALAALEAQLECRREAISRELADIPPPVPACDVHFNRLLEDRGRVVDALQTLRRLRSGSASPAELAAFLAAAKEIAAGSRPPSQEQRSAGGRGFS